MNIRNHHSFVIPHFVEKSGKTSILAKPSGRRGNRAGGLVGAGLYEVGNSHIYWGFAALSHGRLEGVSKVLPGLFVSPLLGFLIGFALMKNILKRLARFRSSIRHVLVISQYFSVAWLGFSHGANDAQKGMAIIGMMLLASERKPRQWL